MNGKIILTFSELGFWRKTYLVIQWLSSFAVAGFCIFVALVSDEPIVVPLVIFAGFVLFLAYWVHTAVVERSLNQLKILAVVNALATNLVGVLILISIYRYSKQELVKNGLPLS